MHPKKLMVYGFIMLMTVKQLEIFSAGSTVLYFPFILNSSSFNFFISNGIAAAFY